ncbi:MAG: ATP-binding protein [Ignavibacteria bacterium]
MNDKNQKTILLVEDEAVIAITEKKTIEKFGYNVITASSGEEAVEIFKESNSIDLIVMDISMGGGINGAETAELILKEHMIPIVFYSTHTEPEMVKKIENIASYGYVVKNSGPAILDVSIKMALRLFESQMKEFEHDAFRRRIYESSRLPIVILDSRTYQIIDCNPATVSIYAFSSKQETLGKTLLDVSALLQYDGTPSSEKIKYFINKALAEGKVIFEWLHQRFNGELWDAEVHLMSFYSNGQKFLQFTLQDITERMQAEVALRESEEKLNTLFSSMTEMVVLYELVFNEQGDAVNYRITDCNNAFTKVTDIKKEDAIGKLATEVYQTDVPPYMKEFAHVGLTGIPYEYSTYLAPIDKYFIISVVSPKKKHVATIATDVTAIRQIQGVISNINKELENYLYITSHDLKAPLVNIQGFSQRLQKQADSIKAVLDECQLETKTMTTLDKITNEDIPRTLSFISSSVIKMDTLLNGLLQISRTGQIMMVIKKVDMTQLFKTIITSFNFQLTELSAKVIVEKLSDCYGDENQLNQLFSNIISNSIKYRDNAKPLVINISSHTQYNKVTYSIKDSGVGIAPRHLEKIWNIFYRVDFMAKEVGEGLGLSIAKRITDKHKGKIWAESEEGKGSVFYVELQTNVFTE